MNYPADKKTIKLSRPLTIGATEVTELHMREPLVFDKLLYEKHSGSPLEKEISMISSLCGVEPAELHQLTAYDYSQLGDALNNFLKSPEKRSKDK
ncbi:phage tail assembly protein [Enterobacter bugandensis]|nr:phage tail assembly protein [Enterobacter bugandensis]